MLTFIFGVVVGIDLGIILMLAVAKKFGNKGE